MITAPHDRFQPALLDRLTDDARDQAVEPDAQRVMSRAQLRAAVLRDLRWLFNAVQPLGPQASGDPAIERSVLNYGLPALSGQLASKIDVGTLERAMREAILRFEPRILPHTLTLRALESASVLDTHNVIEFEIRAQVWSEPMPIEILLRTQLDLEAGEAQVRDLAGTK
jgi:type VI secretion system protein ImpF